MIATTMKLFLSVFFLALNTLSYGGESDQPRKRYAELKQLSSAIAVTSSREAVIALLGEPSRKGTGGWVALHTEVWTYLDYTDDNIGLIFSVRFDPEKGTSVSAIQTLRTEIIKRERRVDRGTVRTVYPDHKTESGFLCDVRFDDGMLIGVAVSDRARVKGEPIPGARIQIEHYGFPTQYIFVGHWSLYLDAIQFTKGDARDAGKASPKPQR